MLRNLLQCSVKQEARLILLKSLLAPHGLLNSKLTQPQQIIKGYSNIPNSNDSITFDQVCKETLDSLAEYFEELIETQPALKNGDVAYSDGVITASLGNNFGTYVVNRQTPNQQIWLSSPKSGPKRYDFISKTWIYKHNNTTLHELLEQEISHICQQQIEFTKHCAFGLREDNTTNQ